jgi:hypothetical protein
MNEKIRIHHVKPKTNINILCTRKGISKKKKGGGLKYTVKNKTLRYKYQVMNTCNI